MQKTYSVILFLAVLFSVNAQTVINVTENITTDATWSSNNVYMLDGLVFVDSLATLTIEPGTVIKGKLQSNITTGDGASALIVRRGAKIMASGTPESPIIFTSELDDLNLTDDLSYELDRGLWGGLIVLGRAVTNQPTTSNQIEGIPNEPATYARYGGNDDSDNSGVLRYISIRHGGYSISGVPGDEINGLTMGAVGNGTTIEYIEVFANLDDGYEWFGGTVNTKYLVAAFCADDAFDYDQGWRGKNQFWFVIQGADEAGRGGEHDGGDDNETGTPYAIPMIANATYIGSGKDAVGVGGDGNDRVIYFRDNAGGKYYNSIFTEFVASSSGITVEDIEGEDSRSRLESGELELKNNYWWNIGASNAIGSIATQDFVQTHLTSNNNMISDPMLRGISREQNNGLDPRPEVNSSASNGAASISDNFFTNTLYHGAFDPNQRLWIEGWSALSNTGFTPVNTVDVEEDLFSEIPNTFTLSQNYPNPFNPTTNIQFSLPQATNVKLTIFNVLGQQVAELVNSFKEAGNYNVNWNASNLTSGIYLYRLEAGNKIITKKMTLLK